RKRNRSSFADSLPRMPDLQITDPPTSMFQNSQLLFRTLASRHTLFLPPIDDGSMVEIGYAPSRSVDQAGDARHLLEIDLVYSIGRTMVVLVKPRKIEDYRYSLSSVVVVIASIEEFQRMAFVIIGVVETHLREFTISMFAESAKLGTVFIRA